MSATLSHDLSAVLRGAEGPGFALYPGFGDEASGQAMLADVVGLARAAHRGEDIDPALLMRETQAHFEGERPEDLVSKIFRLHRRKAFVPFLADPRISEILAQAIGPNVDCFLSQFIFKNPGAWGQPWHQDSYYFNHQPAGPIVGLWLAITEATLENGCLHILPGSQNEPVHEHVPDARPDAQLGYVEIVDHDMTASQPCLLAPGDLMVFDSHLMHRSTDNESKGLRAAMVWHCAAAGTEDLGFDLGNGRRVKGINTDWMPVLREGVGVVSASMS